MKYYLTLILGTYSESEDEIEFDCLMLYKKDMRNLVGDILYSGVETCNPKAVFIPLFYQDISSVTFNREEIVSVFITSWSTCKLNKKNNNFFLS